MKNKHKDFFEDRPGAAGPSETLDEYIRVSKPGTKVVLAALLTVLAAVIVWGLIGKLPVTETVKGLVVNPKLYELIEQIGNDGQSLSEKAEQAVSAGILENASGSTDATSGEDDLIYCFIDASRYNITQIHSFGDKASLEMPDHKRFSGTIRGSLKFPLSTLECKKLLFGNDWATEKCVKTDYSWWLTIKPDEDISDYEFMLCDVSIVTEEVAPISFLAG